MHNRLLIPGVLAVIATLLLVAPPSSFGQSKRALVIGINQYSPPAEASPMQAGREWNDLHGAVNDAEAIAVVLSARGFGVTLLTDTQATRDGILRAIQENLINAAHPGDEVVFYYAGHGSQVVNTASTERNQLDESLVPADAWKGAPDIRDKEIGTLFNELLDRVGPSGDVTLIFDSCHSGSITRGMGRARTVAPSGTAVHDETRVSPTIESRAMVISAAQDHQPSIEMHNENRTAHGAFTWALIQSLNAAEPGASVQRIFESARARLKVRVPFQEPVLAGPIDRRNHPFLGDAGSASSARSIFAMDLDRPNRRVILQGGFAAGLRPGAELTGAESDHGDSVRLRVVASRGAASSAAEVVSGDFRSVRVGDEFRVDRWAAASGNVVRLWMPQAADREVVRAVASKLQAVVSEAGATLIADPTVTVPTHAIESDGSSVNITSLTDDRVTKINSTDGLGATIAVLVQSRESAGVLLELPPTIDLVSAIAKRSESTGSFEIVETREEADYWLTGRFHEDEVEYAWVRPHAYGATGQSSLPARSDWLTPDAADTLADYAERIGRIWGWMHLDSPIDAHRFPVKLLGLEETASRRLIQNQDTVRSGQQFRVRIGADSDAIKRAIGDFGGGRRYVYLFAITSTGDSYLLHPHPEYGTVEAQVTLDADEPEHVFPNAFDALFGIGPPYGADTIFLLTTDEALPNPLVLEGSGIRSMRDSGGADESDLGQLLSGVGTRSITRSVPSNWSIDRLTIFSIER